MRESDSSVGKRITICRLLLWVPTVLGVIETMYQIDGFPSSGGDLNLETTFNHVIASLVAGRGNLEPLNNRLLRWKPLRNDKRGFKIHWTFA